MPLQINELGDIQDPANVDNNLGLTYTVATEQDINDLSSLLNSLTVVKENLYEYKDIWAEESGGTSSNNAQWSFGNGATGFIGIPIDENWEVESMYFQADTYPATATIQVDLMDYGNTPSSAAANTIASISLSSSTDGGGATNNAYKYEKYANPILIVPNGGFTVIGFITRTETGNISDARVGARLRRKIGEYVKDVLLNNIPI